MGVWSTLVAVVSREHIKALETNRQKAEELQRALKDPTLKAIGGVVELFAEKRCRDDDAG